MLIQEKLFWIIRKKNHNIELSKSVIWLTFTGSLLRSFFWRSFSRLGGATSTTYGFRSEARSSFRLCGCRLITQNLPLETTVRMASIDVPVCECRIV